MQLEKEISSIFIKSVFVNLVFIKMTGSYSREDSTLHSNPSNHNVPSMIRASQWAVLGVVKLKCQRELGLDVAACNLPCCPAGSCLQSPAAAWCTLSNMDQRTTLQAAPCSDCREYNVDGSGPTQHNIKVFPNFWLLSVDTLRVEALQVTFF